jgi:exodeoxyribonuclease V alpha subunit
MLQKRINPSCPGKNEYSKSHAAGEAVFREGDPVMVMKNSTAFDVSNGEVGIIREIIKDEDDIDIIRVRFDEKTVDFSAREAPIELSYATTVHKSQGSEYPVVIMVLMKSHYIMLKRKLVYTAISRARDHLILVGQEAAYNIAVHGEESAESRRNTFLGRRIAERIGT